MNLVLGIKMCVRFFGYIMHIQGHLDRLIYGDIQCDISQGSVIFILKKVHLEALS